MNSKVSTLSNSLKPKPLFLTIIHNINRITIFMHLGKEGIGAVILEAQVGTMSVALRVIASLELDYRDVLIVS